jgi:hypothetical protein
MGSKNTKQPHGNTVATTVNTVTENKMYIIETKDTIESMVMSYNGKKVVWEKLEDGYYGIKSG